MIADVNVAASLPSETIVPLSGPLDYILEQEARESEIVSEEKVYIYKKPQTPREIRNAPYLEDALDPDREGYLRSDILKQFRDAYLYVEKRAIEFLEDSELWDPKSKFDEQLEDAKAFINSGGKDAESMFKTEAWHLIFYIAQMLHPSHFTYYPGHQQVTIHATVGMEIIQLIGATNMNMDRSCRKSAAGDREVDFQDSVPYYWDLSYERMPVKWAVMQERKGKRNTI
ncbi:uncharacterized protein DFL_002932 [Arthrobotrys flagrans]|uniref:Uncharacterized protein n=1 Tax=Arthrobotrys flagrans TaxID=97331 RepID=A0A437ABX5_ARTFL|nr:hypothetical protein DFL_002932 [Arthrobotrys flagrans]